MADWSDDDDVWWKLKRGGHDYHKVYAAYKAAMEHNGQPTVILAKTIKGWFDERRLSSLISIARARPRTCASG